MAKSIISDARQADTKERDHMGSGKHERLVFSMSPTGVGTPASVEEVVEHLVLKQQGRAPGSFAMSAQMGYLVKVTVLWGCQAFNWEVRKDGKVTDMGIAVINDQGEVDQERESDESTSV